MSVGYGNRTGLGELIDAMEKAALQDTTTLNYLKTTLVCMGFIEEMIKDTPALVFMPDGSPETNVGEYDASLGVYAIHKVSVWFIIRAMSLDDRDAILGTEHKVGLIPFVEDGLSFFNGNLLNLTGIEQKRRPRLIAPDRAYTIGPTKEESYLYIAICDYEAHTLPFAR